MSTYELSAGRAPAAQTPAAIGAQPPALVLYALHFSFLILLTRPAELWPPLAAIRPVLLSFALLVGAWMLAGRKTVVFHHRISYYAAGLLAAMCLSIPMSYWAARSASLSIAFLEQLVAIMLLLNIVRSRAVLIQFFGVFVCANAFHALLLINNAVSGSYDGRVFGEAGSIFSDPNDLALNFVVAIPIAYWTATQCQRGLSKLLFYAALAVLAGGLVASQSRGGMLGAAAMCGMLSVGWSRKLPLLVTLATVAGAIYLLTPAEFAERFATVSEYESDESAMSRLYLWQQGLRMWLDHPMFGVGYGAFQLAYGMEYLDASAPTNQWLAAHNSLIHLAAELGTLGLACWLGMIAAAFAALRQVRRWRPWLQSTHEGWQLSQLTVALRASLVGYCACAMFLSRAYDWMLLIVLACSIVCHHLAAEHLAAIGESEPEPDFP